MNNNMSCGICLENMPEIPLANIDISDNQYKWYMTDCGHLFHRNCISEWFTYQPGSSVTTSTTCPMCRCSTSPSQMMLAFSSSPDDNAQLEKIIILTRRIKLERSRRDILRPKLVATKKTSESPRSHHQRHR